MHFLAGENRDVVKIRGPKEDVDKCYKHLMKIVKELNESSCMTEVPIYKQFHKFVIGKGGANIRKVSMIVWPSVLKFVCIPPKWGVQYYTFMLHKQIWNCMQHFPVFSFFVMFFLKLVKYKNQLY